MILGLTIIGGIVVINTAIALAGWIF